MELTPERLATQLRAEPFKPAYLIAGPEVLRVLECADAVRAKAREEGSSEREVFEAEGRGFDYAQVAAAFQAMGLFSSRRLIELRLPTGKPGKDGAEVILAFCANPSPGTTLLVTAPEWSRAHAGKWSEAIARIGHVAVAWAVKPHEWHEWVAQRLRSRQVNAAPDAVAALAHRTEGNLLACAQEVDKLSLLLSPGELLDARRMENLVSDSARFDVFRLLDVALNGEAAAIPRMLDVLRAEGVAVPALTGMVAMELQRLAALACVQARGGNLQAEFKARHVWDSKQAQYRRALTRHATPRFELMLAELGEVDRTAKGRGEGDAWLRLERLLLALATPAAMPLVRRRA